MKLRVKNLILTQQEMLSLAFVYVYVCVSFSQVGVFGLYINSL